jgi:hypothetical protein
MIAHRPGRRTGKKTRVVVPGRRRTEPADGDIVQTARMLGISFGDE